jgi:hypothetical protein
VLSRTAVTHRYARSVLAALCAIAGVLVFSGASAQAAITHPYTGTSFGPVGVGAGSFSDAVGVAVEQVTGDVFVLDAGEGGRVYKFNAVGEPVDFSASATNVIEGVGSAGGSEEEIAVDSSTGPDAGDIYVANNSVVRVYAASGSFLGELSGGEMCGVAVDPSGNVYVGVYPETVRRYAPVSNPVTNANETGSMGGLSGVCNVAVDNEGDVYAATYNGGVNKYDALQFGSLSASGVPIDARGKTLAVDPAGGEVLIDEENKIVQYDGSAEPPALQGKTGASDESGALSGSFGVAVDQVTGEVYAANKSNVEIFGAGVMARPNISNESFAEVGSSSAVVSAEIDPADEAATYYVEYGPSTSYGSSTQPISVGAGETPVAVVSRLRELQPGVTYHFRFVAVNASGPRLGADVTFTAHVLVMPGLPDGRGYEKVSPNNNAGSNIYQDIPSDLSFEGQSTEEPFVVAPEGNTITYVGGPPEHGGIGTEGTDAGNQEVATRNARGGWSSANVVPAAATLHDIGRYVGFTNDLSVGFLDFPGAPLAAGAPGEGFNTLYSRTFSTGAYEAFVKTRPPNRAANEFEAPGLVRFVPNGAGYAGSSVGLGHVLFEANDALTPNAHDGGVLENNLYDTSAGTTTLVNILPNGQTDPNATFGGPGSLEPSGGLSPSILTHDISEDGSRIFWTDLNTGNLYVRENDTTPQSSLAGETCTVPADGCTVLIAESARFWSATPDGSKVLYTQGGDLYEKDLDTEQAIDLAPHGEVKGVAGSSEDLSYVYFVADAALAPGAQKQNCDEQERTPPILTRCNLYAVHLGGPTSFIGALSPEDNASEPQTFEQSYGTWRAGLSNSEAEVTPDGAHLLFVSTEPLTGYESRGRGEVFLYDFGSSELSCVSCNQTGEAPLAGRQNSGAYLPASHLATKAPQWISDDADRVFFDSEQALVPQDTNHRYDVYEWEADGSGSCTLSPGCIYLLSDGTSPEGSWLIGSSASGDDVFFTTRGKLVPEDENENIDVYDARVGVTAPPASPQCTGSGCQGVPSTPPIFATPPSVTYNGVGNFAAPSSVSVKAKAKAKPLMRAQKLAKALKACRKRTKRKRAACERQALGKYGAKANKKPSSKQRGNVKKSSRRGK